MPKWLKMLIGVLLLPLCVGAGQALWLVLRASGKADTIWVATLAGAACWVVIYLLLPKPMWIYVVGHELTHALWALIFGGKVKKFKVTSKGGHVIVTKSNFIIALTPYFFPLYAILVAVGFVAGNYFWNWHPYLAWFHLLLGAAYAFHVTLTWHILQCHQTDISEQGYIFSSVIIFLGNVVVLIVAISLLSGQVALPKAGQWWWDSTLEFSRQLTRVIRHQ